MVSRIRPMDDDDMSNYHYDAYDSEELDEEENEEEFLSRDCSDEDPPSKNSTSSEDDDRDDSDLPAIENDYDEGNPLDWDDESDED